MQDAAIPTDPKLVEEMLRQRGLMAYGGNIRLMPFENNASTTPQVDALGSATAAALSQNGGGGIPVQDVNGNQILLPTNAQSIPENVSNESLVNVLPFLTGALGAGLAMMIRNRLAQRGITMPTDDPLAPNVPAATSSNRANGMEDIIDGEFTEVNEPQLTKGANATNSPADQVIEAQKRLPAPQGKLADEGSKPKYLTSQQLARRRAQNLPSREGSGPTVYAADAYSDITDEEMKQARTIADSLVQRRRAGNIRRDVKGKTTIGREHLPTGDLDKEGALNLVIKAIRDAKLHPQNLRKVIP